MSSEYNVREFVEPLNGLCAIYDQVWFPEKFFKFDSIEDELIKANQIRIPD